MSQTQGLTGRLVAKMIRNTVRARFRAVYWQPPATVPDAPIIFVPNHHGWHDGYLMFHVVTALRRPSLDWIQEFDAFPLFRTVGGMPYPPDRPEVRAATIRQTIRELRAATKSLVLFAEPRLHPGPEVLPFGRGLEVLMRQVPSANVCPIALVYTMDIHERPSAFIRVGPALSAAEHTSQQIHDSLCHELDQLRHQIHDPSHFQILVHGTKDVNERLKPPSFRSRP